jgi:hypothetical protein
MTTMMVQETKEKGWEQYLAFLGVFLLVSAPALIFSTLRDKLKNAVNDWNFYLIWGTCFILLPIAYYFLGISLFFENVFAYHPRLLPSNVGGDAIISILCSSILFTELVILSNEWFINQRLFNKWIQKINLEWAILGIVVILSTFVVFAILPEHYEEEITTQKYWRVGILFSFQFALMLFLYYIFYWINHYFLINKVLQKKGAIYYAFSFLGVLFLLFPIIAQLIAYIPIVDEWKIHPVYNHSIFNGINLTIPMIGMVLTIPFILAFQWFKQRSAIAILEKEKSETELNLLKQQINPHFFFNTLNNLYALSLKQDERTPEVILQLSDLMRYVIYKGKESQVTLSEEMTYIEDYIDLQMIRLHKQLDYSFEKEINDKSLSIPPLLFIILVENAFKHGIEPAVGDCFLHLFLKNDETGITFICENSFDKIEDTSKGIGLENLKKRLNLLYKNKHELTFEEIEKNEKWVFKASMKLISNE